MNRIKASSTQENAKCSASDILARLRSTKQEEKLPTGETYDESPTAYLTEATAVWRIEDSSVGSGTIEAHAKVETSPMIELTLKWMGECEQPEIWQIFWWHHPDYILDNLPQYLIAYCPVGCEMIEVLKSLGLENFPTDEEVAE